MRSFIRGLIALLSVICSGTAFADLKWLRNEPNQDTVIVFVHGFKGDKRTWTYLGDSEVSFWPQIVKDDPDFQGANIAVYLYQTEPLASNTTIEVMAKSAQELLSQVNQYKNVVFVAHSVGGVLVKTFLLGYQEFSIKHKIHLHLFGAPTTGHQVRMLYKLSLKKSAPDKSKNNKAKDEPDETLDTVEHPADTLLEFHNLFWYSIKDHVTVNCYWEYKETTNTSDDKDNRKDGTEEKAEPHRQEPGPQPQLLVPPAAAANHCNDAGDRLPDTDHFTMVKPKDRADPIHIKFATRYNTNGQKF